MANNWVVILSIPHLKLNETKILEIVYSYLQWKHFIEKIFTIFSYSIVIILWDPSSLGTDNIISEIILKMQQLITEYHKRRIVSFHFNYLKEQNKTKHYL